MKKQGFFSWLFSSLLSGLGSLFAEPDLFTAAIVIIILLAVIGAILGPVSQAFSVLVDLVTSQNFTSLIRWLRIVFIIFDLLLLWFTIAVLRKFLRLRHHPVAVETPTPAQTPAGAIQQSWEQIRRLAHSSNPSEWNMAVIRADALLDDVLLHMGYQAPTFADRLKIVDPTVLRSLDRVWSAHRLRNLIAHEPNQTHAHDTILRAIETYEIALSELGYAGATEIPPSPANK